MKTCSTENCNNPIWSKGVCKNHMIKKPMADGKTKRTVRMFTGVQGAKSFEKSLLLREFFLSIWKKRPHRSEVSGEYLGSEPMSTYFHHILPKNKYPEACLDEENIVILSLIEHSNVENDMYKYEEINRRREQLNLKYERT
jgi:hypothetical protein